LKRMEEKRDAGVLLNLEFELGRAASMARSKQAPQAARILGEQKNKGKSVGDFYRAVSMREGQNTKRERRGNHGIQYGSKPCSR
jgi:hypothetical protein